MYLLARGAYVMVFANGLDATPVGVTSHGSFGDNGCGIG